MHISDDDSHDGEKYGDNNVGDAAAADDFDDICDNHDDNGDNYGDDKVNADCDDDDYGDNGEEVNW